MRGSRRISSGRTLSIDGFICVDPETQGATHQGCGLHDGWGRFNESIVTWSSSSGEDFDVFPILCSNRFCVILPEIHGNGMEW